jgi:hypothetical protein
MVIRDERLAVKRVKGMSIDKMQERAFPSCVLKVEN